MDIKEYVKCVYELEKSCYEQNALIHLLEKKCAQLQHPNLHSRIIAEPLQKPRTDLSGAILGGAFFGAIGAGVSLFCGTGALAYAAIIKIGNILNYPTDESLVFLLIAIGIVFVIGMLFGALVAWLKWKKQVRESIKVHSESVQFIENENAKIAKINYHIQYEANRKAALLSTKISEAKKCYLETNQLLQSYYSLDVIYPKYRSFVPITMFFEYLSSGRCAQLEGHEGAYNIYEQELRMNLILNKLDDIIVRLDRIQENQYMLANAIKQSNETAQRIYNAVATCADQLHDISANTEATMYFSQVSALNTTYIAWLKKNS